MTDEDLALKSSSLKVRQGTEDDDQPAVSLTFSFPTKDMASAFYKKTIKDMERGYIYIKLVPAGSPIQHTQFN